MNDAQKNLGETLFNIRIEKGLSLREFSEQLNISHAYLNKLEKGVDPRTGKDVTPTIETLAKISYGLGMQLTDLLDISGYLDDRGIESRNGKAGFTSDEKEAAEQPVLALEALIDEFIDVITASESISYKGKIIDKSKNEALILAAQEMLSHQIEQ